MLQQTNKREEFQREAAYCRENEVNIVARLESRLASGTSMVRIANETGLSLGTIGGVLNPSQRPIVNSIYPREETSQYVILSILATWLNEEDAAAPNTENALALTPTYKRISALIRMTHEHNLLTAITGGVGIGKSEAARNYAATHPKTINQTGAVYVQFKETDAKPSAALNRVFEAIPGMGVAAHRQDRLMDAIAQAMKPGDLLIADECNYLHGRDGRFGRALDSLRDLFDTCRIGIVMVGNPDLSVGVWGEQQDDFAALVSRAERHDFPHTTEEDVDAWLNWAGLTGKKIRVAAINIGARPGPRGGLRALHKVIDAQRRMYPDNEGNADAFIATAKLIGRWE